MATLKEILPQLNAWCKVNNISVQSVYDACHGMTLQELVYYLFGVVQQTAEEVVDYQTAFDDLKDFVDNYFNNLDVQEEINNKLDAMAEDGSLQQIISAIMSNFLNVVENGIDNTGTSYCDVELNQLINNNPGRTIYFPKGNYKIKSPIILPVDSSLTSYFFDSSARIYTDVDIDSVVIFRNVSGNSNYRRIISRGGIFDANSHANNCVTIESLARHFNLDSAVAVNPKVNGFQIGDSDETNKGAYNIFITNCKGVGIEVPLNNTTGLIMYDTDNWITNFQCTGFDIAMNMSNTSGNKVSDVHVFTGQNAGTQAGFMNTVGIIDGNMNVYNNIYVDSFYCCFRKHSSVVSSINNLIVYWSTLYNYSVSSRVFDVGYRTYLNVTNCTFNKINAKSVVEVMLYDDGGDIASWVAQRRLNIKNIRKVDYATPLGTEWNPYYALMYQPCKIGYTNVEMQTTNAYLIGYISALNGVITINIEGLNFSYDLTLKSYTEQSPVIQSVNIKYGEMPFSFGFGLVENHNGLNMYPVYLIPKSNETINYSIVITQMNDSSTYFSCIPSPSSPEIVTIESLEKKTDLFFNYGELSNNVSGAAKYISIGNKIIIDINLSVTDNITLLCKFNLSQNCVGGGSCLMVNGNTPTACGVSNAGNFFITTTGLDNFTINQRIEIITKPS